MTVARERSMEFEKGRWSLGVRGFEETWEVNVAEGD